MTRIWRIVRSWKDKRAWKKDAAPGLLLIRQRRAPPLAPQLLWAFNPTQWKHQGFGSWFSILGKEPHLSRCNMEVISYVLWLLEGSAQVPRHHTMCRHRRPKHGCASLGFWSRDRNIRWTLKFQFRVIKANVGNQHSAWKWKPFLLFKPCLFVCSQTVFEIALLFSSTVAPRFFFFCDSSLPFIPLAECSHSNKRHAAGQCTGKKNMLQDMVENSLFPKT